MLGGDEVLGLLHYDEIVDNVPECIVSLPAVLCSEPHLRTRI